MRNTFAEGSGSPTNRQPPTAAIGGSRSRQVEPLPLGAVGRGSESPLSPEQIVAYPCTSCGSCCRRAYLIPDSGLPLKADGSCANLGADNKCQIYETRPLLCRVDESFVALTVAGKVNMTRAEWFSVNARACNQFIKEDKLDPKYLIRVWDDNG